MTQDKHQRSSELLSFIDQSPSAYHAAANLASLLAGSGYSPYRRQERLKTGDKRYLVIDGSALIAFSIGTDPLRQGFRIVGSHVDAPSLKIKPASVMRSEGCIKLNTEIYGGPILNTWLDRPLALAGRVILAGSHPLEPFSMLVRLDEPLLVIPNLAIHMNRTVNDGVKIEPQKMMLPVLGLAGPGNSPDEQDPLLAVLARSLSLEPQAILDYDLFLYEHAPSTHIGLRQELISAPRLDNLGMAYAAVTALTASGDHAGIDLAVCFDHEEVGSQSRQGAQSMLLRDLLEQVTISLGGSRSDFLDCIGHSFLISADQAHAVHPNFAEFADAGNRPRINGGPVIKSAASRSYTSDGDSASVFRALCQKVNVPCQVFVNRSDLRGGSTIGPVFTEHLPVRAVDAGNPIWAMHSIRETGGVDDHSAMIDVLSAFYSLEALPQELSL